MVIVSLETKKSTKGISRWLGFPTSCHLEICLGIASLIILSLHIMERDNLHQQVQCLRLFYIFHRDINKYDYILAPINLNQCHSVLLIVNVKAYIMILHFNSLNGDASLHTCTQLLKYVFMSTPLK